jgi:rhamnogalacturonan endolyase
MLFLGHITSALAFCQGAYAAFGLTSTSTAFTVDTDAGLVFTVTK